MRLLAAGLLKRVHLELGGNSALVVLEDADLEQAVTAGSFGSFHNAGRCAWPNRHLVAAPLVEEYTTPISRKSSGPSRTILAFKEMDEAAQLAAQTGYGLSLAIQTTDIVSGAQKSVDLLENLVETADLYGARRLMDELRTNAEQHVADYHQGEDLDLEAIMATARVE
jgi:acyl-CoA reductase-like NAD-dependent aldehyde dehydrogenase